MSKDTTITLSEQMSQNIHLGLLKMVFLHAGVGLGFLVGLNHFWGFGTAVLSLFCLWVCFWVLYKIISLLASAQRPSVGIYWRLCEGFGKRLTALLIRGGFSDSTFWFFIALLGLPSATAKSMFSRLKIFLQRDDPDFTRLIFVKYAATEEDYEALAPCIAKGDGKFPEFKFTGLRYSS